MFLTNYKHGKIELSSSIITMSNYIPITDRTKSLALRIIKAYGWLKQQNDECKLIGKQLFRSGTSTGAMGLLIRNS